MNQTQKNFRKQMKKGLQEVKDRDKDSYYKYLMQNHLDNPKQRFTQDKNEKVKGFFGRIFKTVFNIIIIIIFISGAGTYIAGRIKNGKPITTKDLVLNTINSRPITNATINSNQQNIINYLKTISTYQTKIYGDINLRNKDVDSFNKKLMTKKEYMDNLTVYKNRINSNYIEMDKISCTKELSNYKAMIKKQNQTMCKAIDCEIQYLNTNNSTNKNKASQYYKSYNDLNKNINNEFDKVLDKNGIKH